MPLRLELKPSPTGPGYAVLTILGWKEGTANIEAAVQRNQDSRYLDESGNWTTHPVWHDVSVLEQNGDSLSGEMGPWLVDPLMANPQVAYMFEMRNAEAKDKGVLRMVGHILSSQAAGNSVRQESRTRHEQSPAPSPTPAPSVTPAPVVETPTVIAPTIAPVPVQVTPSTGPSTTAIPPISNPSTGTPPPTTPPIPAPVKKSRMLPLILMLLLLLPLLGGAAWYFGLLPDLGIALPTTAANSTSDAKDEGVCGVSAMTDADDLAFVQSCVKSSPSSEQVMAVIEAAKQAERCNIVQRLYAHKAQSGDTKIAFAYAREYDPESFKDGGCIKSADAETAAYWYEIVVANDASNTVAKQRLEQLSAKSAP
jgi:hypothetical protein